MPSLWIWPFELQEKIGEGGMGIVYQARYVKDDRLFAVKLIPAEITNKTLIARFEREIEILKTLRHPNIVRAFGGVCEDKQRFYAMELVDGGTLWDKIQTHGFLPWEKVTDWGQQMCAALAYAHAKGIIHRDVKPNNFLVTKAGQLKLSDFGLVSVMSEAKLTADGRTLGTVQYMSPEQIRGKPPLTPATDIYSLGCVFYEMLTGQPPYVGENPGPIMHAHLHDIPRPISEVNKDCPVTLERLVLQMVEKDPEQRPASAEEVAERLSQIRISPHMVGVNPAAMAATKPRVSLAEAPDVLQPAYNTAQQLWEKIQPFLGAAVAAGVILLAITWAWSLLKTDPGTTLWLRTLTEHSDPTVRAHAAQIVGELAEGNRQLLEPLMQLAEDESAPLEARNEALRQLGKQGSRANRFRSRIQKLAKTDPTESIRLQATSTLTSLGS